MTAVAQPVGTVTLVFSDIEGSTKLLEELGTDAYRDALAEHRRIVREAYGRYSGYEVDYEGDAFFYTFASASDAVAAVAEAMVGLADGPIAIRVGIHTGTPVPDPPKYVGMDVHFAARVMSSAHGGQVVCSKATAELVELELTELGEHRLKDIAEAVALYQVGEGSFPPLKSISNTNLPRAASSFLGRQAELEQVLARIDQGARLLTLTGPGGIGKTRLALEGASSLVGANKAGVFWVGLATLRDPALVNETIAQTLGAKDDLASHIGEREMLLLLDNLEQVIEAAPELSALLGACPNPILLVTSRELLRISGEAEYAVPPLAEPEAVSLFCERAQLEPSAEIAELCARLDSLPLAVELAAARTRALTPAQILERLSQRLDLLKGGRDSDPRQQTLRATIEWSYELLSPLEQELFARLSVFSGGCTLEAADDVCDAALDTLQSLVEKSLLRFSNERYWMLETIRDFAGERLEASGEADGLRGAHARWVVVFAESVGGRELLKDGPLPVARLSSEIDNVRAAVQFFLDRGDSRSVLRVGIALWFFWNVQGHSREARNWLDEAVRTSPPDGDELLWGRVALSELERFSGSAQRARELKQDALAELRARGETRVVAALLADLGDIAMEAGSSDDARALLEESMELRRQIGGAGLGRTLASLGDLALLQGEFERAERLFEQAFERAAATDPDGAHMASSYEGLGEAIRRQADAARAARVFADGLRVSLRLGDISGVLDLLDALAEVAFDQGEDERAGRLVGAAGALREREGVHSWTNRTFRSLPADAVAAGAA